LQWKHKFSLISHIHNDEPLIPYYIRHWRDRIDRAYIVDDGPSTDGGMDIIRRECPDWVIIERESYEWDAVAIDQLCRQIERTVDGWVVLVTVDEFIYPTRSELEGIFDRAEAGGYDFIQTEGWQVVQHPSESFDPEKEWTEQFFWGVPEPMISRTIHRNQQMANWDYPIGRHQFPQIVIDPQGNWVESGFMDKVSPEHPLLGDHKYAPKDLAFHHMLVDGSRVGPLDQSRGFGLNKVGRTWEKLEAEYQEVLSKAKRFR